MTALELSNLSESFLTLLNGHGDGTVKLNFKEVLMSESELRMFRKMLDSDGMMIIKETKEYLIISLKK